jgi:hypothetical protein
MLNRCDRGPRESCTVQDFPVKTLRQATPLETYVFPASDLTMFERLRADYTRHATRPGAFAIDNMLLHLGGEA